jgi:hypothetical protein
LSKDAAGVEINTRARQAIAIFNFVIILYSKKAFFRAVNLGSNPDPMSL